MKDDVNDMLKTCYKQITPFIKTLRKTDKITFSKLLVILFSTDDYILSTTLALLAD